MSPRTRIIENSKNPAIGGGRTYVAPAVAALDVERAWRLAGQLVEDRRRLGLGHLPDAGGRLAAVNGLIGSSATRPASRSVNSMRRIVYRELRRRRALGKAVQALHEVLVGAAGGKVRHKMQSAECKVQNANARCNVR